jgi:hypothetical protein
VNKLDEKRVIEFLKSIEGYELIDILRKVVVTHIEDHPADTDDFINAECNTSKQLLQIMWACKE